MRSDRRLTICNGCCTDQLLADRLPGGQGLDELNATDIAEMLSSSQLAYDSHSRRRSSRQIADEELRREHAALKTKLAEIQAGWDMDLHSSEVSGDRRSFGTTSSHADSAGLRSTKSADKASAAEAEGAAGAGKAGKGLPEPDQAPAGRQPKGGSSKKKKSQRKGSKAGPVESQRSARPQGSRKAPPPPQQSRHLAQTPRMETLQQSS